MWTSPRSHVSIFTPPPCKKNQWVTPSQGDNDLHNTLVQFRLWWCRWVITFIRVPWPKIRLCKHVWMECFDFKVFTRVSWCFMTIFAPLTHVFRCAVCKPWRYTWKLVDTPKSWHTVCLIFGRGPAIEVCGHWSDWGYFVDFLANWGWKLQGVWTHNLRSLFSQVPPTFP